MQQGVFWSVSGFFWCFLFSVFLCFCFVKKGPKGHFPAILELFSILFLYFPAILEFFLFCSPKRPVENTSFLPILFLFFVFLLSSLSNSIFSLLFVHQPLFGTHYFWRFSFVVCCLPFPFLMLACFFETNFPNMPF